jgi:hypothetical protein
MKRKNKKKLLGKKGDRNEKVRHQALENFLKILTLLASKDME